MRHLFPFSGLVVWVATVALAAEPTDLLKSVEARYNSTKTLQAGFTQVYTERGRSRLPLRGTVYIRKSDSRTRWDYTEPAGDFFLSDGKFTYEYHKDRNTVERAPFKNTDDARIPLSFLLGQLNFAKDFEQWNTSRSGANATIELFPKNKKLLFNKIALLVAPDASILRVTVYSDGGTTVEYTLTGEQRNIKLADSLFRFVPPPQSKMLEDREEP